MDSNTVRQQWARRSGEYSPQYYAYYGPNETSELIRARLGADLDPDAAILELGCSSGRHLAHLQEHGYTDLHGIEINNEAFSVMEESYPELASQGTFYSESIQDAVTDFEDAQFDAVFSVETLQHLHPDDEWVFAELSRIVDDRLLTVENESGVDRDVEELDVNYVNDEFPLYYRDWNDVFSAVGLAEIESRTAGRDVFRVFQPAGN